MLDGEVAVTAPAIYAALAVECLPWTRSHTCPATSARLCARLVGRDGCRGDDFAKKKSGTEPGDDELIVEPDEADTGLHGPIALAQRSCVDTHAHFAAKGSDYGLRKFEKQPAHLMVIVISEAVGCKPQCACRLWRRRRISHCTANHRLCPLKQQSGITAHIAIARGIVHRCVPPVGYPSVIYGHSGVINLCGRSKTDAGDAKGCCTLTQQSPHMSIVVTWG